jgi:hypothetical protein
LLKHSQAAPNNSFKPTPCRGVGHVLYATLAHVRRPATGRLNSGVRPHRMSYRDHKADDIAEAIRQVLIREWDPIGVMDDPEWPRDEYDSYIGEVYRYLARGESAEFIARHLCFIEERLMGLAGC